MKPIRREELNHLENTIKSKFRSKANAVDSEIQQQAQELSDKKKPKFPAACKVDKKLDRLKAAGKTALKKSFLRLSQERRRPFKIILIDWPKQEATGRDASTITRRSILTTQPRLIS